MAYDTWGGSWGTSWGLSWTRGAPPPPPPPTPTGPSIGGGLGWWVDEDAVRRFREKVERVEKSVNATRKEQRLAQEDLRLSLESAYRGDPEIAVAIAETLSPVVDLSVAEIDWRPAMARLDLLAGVIGKLGIIAELEKQARLDELRDEQDIEMILLTIL